LAATFEISIVTTKSPTVGLLRVYMVIVALFTYCYLCYKANYRTSTWM